MSLKAKVVVTVILLVGLGAVWQFQQLRIDRLHTEISDLRSRLARLGTLQDANDHLAQQLKTVLDTSQTNESELLRLRGQMSRLRQLEQENVQLKSQRREVDYPTQQAHLVVEPSQDGVVTAVSEVTKKKGDNSSASTTELGTLDLSNGSQTAFDLSGGTNCIVTPTALSDGSNMVQISMGVTNTDGTYTALGVSRVTAPPGSHCSISVGDRMIGLAVTLKPQ